MMTVEVTDEAGEPECNPDSGHVEVDTSRLSCVPCAGVKYYAYLDRATAVERICCEEVDVSKRSTL